MKFISFRTPEGSPAYGIVMDDRVLDLTPLLGNRAPDLKSMLAANLQAEARALASAHAATLRLDELDLLPVIPNPDKILCVGLNYADHVQETGRASTESPTWFARFAASQVGHGQAIVRPPESSRLDYEGEIAVVIGTAGRRIPESQAWNHIAGYACYNDGSIRDWQTATSQWTPGKNFWRTGGFGPWMVTADEIAPGRRMTLVTRLNGQEMQRTTTDLLIHSIPRLIAHASTFLPLAPGDVLVTGTPGGVGLKRNPPVFMKPGDVVEVDVDAIGCLRNTIADE